MLGAGFHVVYHFFGLPPSASLAELEAKGRRFCDTDFAAIAAGRGAEIHVETYCFRWPASRLTPLPCPITLGSSLHGLCRLAPLEVMFRGFST